MAKLGYQIIDYVHVTLGLGKRKKESKCSRTLSFESVPNKFLDDKYQLPRTSPWILYLSGPITC